LSEFRIFETEEFQKCLGKLPRQTSRRIQKKLREQVYPQLRNEPFFGPHIKKLRDYSPDVWRYRIGAFRVFYSVHEEERVVCLLTIVQRRDAYR
jgi:mRNA interferase RelE/StbE